MIIIIMKKFQGYAIFGEPFVGKVRGKGIGLHSQAAAETPRRNVVLMFHVVFGQRDFSVTPLTYFYLPKSDRAYLFPNPSKVITFSAIRQKSLPGARLIIG